MKQLLVFLFVVTLFYGGLAQIPQEYYDDADGKIQQDLKTALHVIISNGHTSNTYSSLWQHFQKTDKMPNGLVWDMYSTCNFQFVVHQCGNYVSQCDCYNREHSVPVSWMGGENQYPMYADLHHIVPVDAFTNNKRANYPFGRVGTATWTSFNGSKLGTSMVSGYTGIVFEPIDEYKGDFARIMFYMVTRYENLLPAWSTNDVNATAVLDGTIWPAFKPWCKDLYLYWHENDPVSQKEIARNDSVYKIQNNRNPFIDHPEFARQIWGPDASVSKHAIAQMQIFPVPANDFIEISATVPIVYIYFFDIAGRNISEHNFSSTSGRLDVSALPQGIYFMKVAFENSEVQQKYIIKN